MRLEQLLGQLPDDWHHLPVEELDRLVPDRPRSTLDTTVRRLQPPTEPPILISDTVGFIKKLPHDLVASFRSTLDEAGDADLLLHVVDASDAALADHIAMPKDFRSVHPSGENPMDHTGFFPDPFTSIAAMVLIGHL